MTLLLAANILILAGMLIDTVREINSDSDFFDYTVCGVISAALIANVAGMLR